jgi:phospholipase C
MPSGVNRFATRVRSLLLLLAGTLALASTGCSAGGSGSALTPSAGPAGAVSPDADSGKYIKHVVIVIQENRSFDNLFATFPGADGATSGLNSKGLTIPLKKQPLAGALDVNHDWTTYRTEYDAGKMDGFNLAGIDGNNPAGNYAYQYVDPADIGPYWTMAKQYALLDHLFATQGSGSFTAHQDLIAGGTAIDPIDSIIDYPSEWTSWGCDAPKGTYTSLITKTNVFKPGKGPFPCFTYPKGTLRDLLDAKSVSWKYYAPPYVNNSAGALWNAFAAIDAVRNGPEWNTNISTPEQNVLTDISGGKLPAVSWVIPDQPSSDHPNGKGGKDIGPSWVAQVVNAVGTSSYWKNTAVVVVWDDWGGFYDHIAPQQLDSGGLGFRVPAIVISAYVPAGQISHTAYEFGSILKFVEATFKLGSLGTTDVRATSIANVFNFKQKPRAFRKIKAALSRRYFLTTPASNLPIDSE